MYTSTPDPRACKKAKAWENVPAPLGDDAHASKLRFFLEIERQITTLNLTEMLDPV